MVILRSGEQGLAAGAGEDRVDAGAVGWGERGVVVADPVETLPLVLEWGLAILVPGDLAFAGPPRSDQSGPGPFSVHHRLVILYNRSSISSPRT